VDRRAECGRGFVPPYLSSTTKSCSAGPLRRRSGIDKRERAARQSDRHAPDVSAIDQALLRCGASRDGECAKDQKAAAGRGAGAKVDGESDALTKLTSDDESWIVALIKEAAS
jgi:hypothetical protein